MPIHFFERAQLRASPWKNGGGVTREIACHPPNANMQNFDWRISIAHIASDGDFRYRILHLAVFNPKTRCATRIVTGDAINTLAHQFGHQ